MKLPIILAIDFDETIVHLNGFPKIKGFRKGAKKYINKLHALGFYIIVWTCRTDGVVTKDATYAENYLFYNGLNFDQINQNHPAVDKRFENVSKKVAADLYIDDKGLWPMGLPSWFWLYWLIRLKALTMKFRLLNLCKPEHFN